MTLCGVLKNILLVAASVIFWSTIITPLQYLGYGIALTGLVYYGVGYEGITTCRKHIGQTARLVWSGKQGGNVKVVLGRRVLVVMVVLLVTMGALVMRSADAGEYVLDWIDRLDYLW